MNQPCLYARELGDELLGRRAQLGTGLSTRRALFRERERGLGLGLSFPLPQTLSGVFATNSGIAPHAALPHPLPPPKHVHHVWVWNGLWDHSVRPFRPNNTLPKTSQNRLLADFEPVRDVVSRLGFSTILPLQHHNTRQMGCPEVQNGRHASARRISRVCSACRDAGFQVPYP